MSNIAVTVGSTNTINVTVEYATFVFEGGSGTGDMTKAVYDPQTIEADVFARANHTGTQTASTISDFDTEVSNNTDVVANTAKVGVTTQISNVVEDTTPQLGGNLDGQTFNITTSGQVRINTPSAPEKLGVLSTDTDNSAVGFVGSESGKGTLKITHNKPGVSDANASGLSISLTGAGTAAKGIYLDTTDSGTTGNLLQLRQLGADQFVVNSDGEVTGQLVIRSTALNSDPLIVWSSDGSRLFRLTETGGNKAYFEGNDEVGAAKFRFRADGGDNFFAVGDTGFGTSSPTEKVDVVGNIKATGTITTPDNVTANNFIGVSGWASYIDTEYPNSGSAFTVPANTDTILPNNAGTKIISQKPDDVDTFYCPASLAYTGQTSNFVVGETVTGGTSGASAVILGQNDTGTTGTLYLDVITGTFTNGETITSASGSATANGSNGDPLITGRNGDNLDCMIYFKAVPSAARQWLDIWVDIGGSVGELYRQTISFPKGSGVERGELYALPSAYTLDTWQANGGKIYVRSNASCDIYQINFNFDRSHKAR